MKLYEVNQQIEDLMVQLEPDPETGEIPANEDELIEQINALAMKREDILQYLAKLVLLDRECGGQKTDLGVATLCYRKTSHVEITDKGAALFWLKEMGHEDCYRIPEPEISKLYVGRLLDAGEKIDGVERVTGTSCYLK